jgi:hypothetical protein
MAQLRGSAALLYTVKFKQLLSPPCCLCRCCCCRLPGI